MNNKRLEDRLKKYGTTYNHIILLIEKCESGTVAEIRIDQKEGITISPVLDKMIVTYLRKIKIEVVYTDNKEEITPADDDGRPKCIGEAHKILDSSMKSNVKIKTFKKSKYAMIKLDEDSFVICPLCFDIKKIK